MVGGGLGDLQNFSVSPSPFGTNKCFEPAGLDWVEVGPREFDILGLRVGDTALTMR